MSIYVSKTRSIQKSLRQAGVPRDVDVTTIRGRHTLEAVLERLEGKARFGPYAVNYYEDTEPEKVIEGHSDGWLGTHIHLPDRKPVYYGFPGQNRGGWGREGLGFNAPRRLEILNTEEIAEGYHERIEFEEDHTPKVRYEMNLAGRSYFFDTVEDFEEWIGVKSYLVKNATVRLQHIISRPVVELLYHQPVNRVHWRYTYKPMPVGWVILTSNTDN